MKLFLFIILLSPLALHAQFSHYAGVGTYASLSTLTNPSDSDLISYDSRFAISPFARYTLNANRWNFSIGVTKWSSSFDYSFIIPIPFIPVTVEGIQRMDYWSVPVSVGVNIINGNHLKAGIKAELMSKYLYHIRTETSASFVGSARTDFNGDELDSLGVNKFIFAVGAGAYAGYEIGRFMPMLEAGVLYDLTGAYEDESDRYKF